MRKFVFLFLALSFLSVQAQTKKKTTKKKAKAKTTNVAKPVEEAPVVEAPVVETPAAGGVVDDTPINSMSILNAKSPESFRKYREMGLIKKGDSMVSNKITPLKYGFIEDKDILKSMVVWEIIDMNDKVNQPFYHNEDGLVSQNRSLYQLLFDAINDGRIKEVYDDEMFMTRLSPDAPDAEREIPDISAPRIEPEIGFGNPRYKTFILSAVTMAPFCALSSCAPAITL